MNLYPEPKESLEELEVKLKEACEKLKSLPNPKPASEYSDDADDELFFDIGIARFNLSSFIENLEWKIDLKLFYAKNRRICNCLRIKRLFGLLENWVTR